MSATRVTVLERPDGGCELVVNALGQVLTVRLDCDQAVHLGKLLLDGGLAPTVVGRT